MWASSVAFGDALSAHINTIGRCHSDQLSEFLQHVRDHPSDSRLAVRARHAGDWNATCPAVRIQHLDNGTADVTCFSFAWKTVHAQTRTGIQFQNAAALYGLRNILSNQIDTADIEPGEASSTLAHRLDRRMHFIRNITRSGASRQIYAIGQDHLFLGSRNGLRGQTSTLQMLNYRMIDSDLSQWLLVAFAS